MNKIISIITVYVLLHGLISCEQRINSTESRLVGLWQIAKVDSVVQYILPVKPDTLYTYECNKCILEINSDSSFRMVNPNDTIIGSWNQPAADTLALSAHDYQGNFLNKRNFKFENITSNDLKLFSYGGQVSGSIAAGNSDWIVTEDIRYVITMHYVKIE